MSGLSSKKNCQKTRRATHPSTRIYFLVQERGIHLQLSFLPPKLIRLCPLGNTQLTIRASPKLRVFLGSVAHRFWPNNVGAGKLFRGCQGGNHLPASPVCELFAEPSACGGHAVLAFSSSASLKVPTVRKHRGTQKKGEFPRFRNP